MQQKIQTYYDPVSVAALLPSWVTGTYYFDVNKTYISPRPDAYALNLYSAAWL